MNPVIRKEDIEPGEMGMLEACLKLGFCKSLPNGDYLVTDKGMELISISEETITKMMEELDSFKEEMGQIVFGRSRDASIKSGTCIQCGLPALPRCYSEAGRKEFYISGLCEKCFDEITEGDANA